jgi:ribonuclease BN (tRNA processing enzyme)
VFLGSGGARIVVARQIRATGGIWLSLAGTRLLIDPGPGALVRITSSRHRLDPTTLAGIFLSHRHLDHAGDVNVMVEAMTMGGTERRGVLLAPAEALEGPDPVVLRYLREFLKGIVTLTEGGRYRIGEVEFTCPVRHRHRGEVYGSRFTVSGQTVSYVADTRYFPELADHYRADVVILNVVRSRPSELDHLHVADVELLVREMKPRLTMMTHFGMTMLRARPWVIAREMSERTGYRVVAAADGMRVDLSDLSAAGRRRTDDGCDAADSGGQATEVRSARTECEGR